MMSIPYEIRARCAAVHPLHVARLARVLVGILAEMTGVARENQAYLPLLHARSSEELARVSWVSLYDELSLLTQISGGHLEELIIFVRLLAERAVLHQRLYLSKSGSTLRILRQYALPTCLPLEVVSLRGKFNQHLREADEALRTGRAALGRFQRDMLQGEAPPKLHDALEQAAGCYAAYLQSRLSADEVRDAIKWYLAEDEAALQTNNRQAKAAVEAA